MRIAAFDADEASVHVLNYVVEDDVAWEGTPDEHFEIDSIQDLGEFQ